MTMIFVMIWVEYTHKVFIYIYMYTCMRGHPHTQAAAAIACTHTYQANVFTSMHSKAGDQNPATQQWETKGVKFETAAGDKKHC